jgi:hypothetical protein
MFSASTRKAGSTEGSELDDPAQQNKNGLQPYRPAGVGPTSAAKPRGSA